jgi:hypothetical protein
MVQGLGSEGGIVSTAASRGGSAVNLNAAAADAWPADYNAMLNFT